MPSKSKALILALIAAAAETSRGVASRVTAALCALWVKARPSSNDVMVSRMFASGQQFEVFWSVIRRGAVAVMDVFTAGKFAPKDLFHHHSMLVRPFAGRVNLDHVICGATRGMQAFGPDGLFVFLSGAVEKFYTGLACASTPLLAQMARNAARISFEAAICGESQRHWLAAPASAQSSLVSFESRHFCVSLS